MSSEFGILDFFDSIQDESDWQRGETAQSQIGAPCQRDSGLESPIFQVQQFFEGNLRFDARERCAEAEMCTPTEGEMFVILPGDIEFIGVGKTFGIAIAGAEHGEYCLL